MSQKIEPEEYFLFLDESGDFRETSTVPAELQNTNRDKPIHSQLAGFLVRYEKRASGQNNALRDISKRSAEILSQCFQKAGVQPRKGSDLREEVNKITPHLVEALQKENWQPVRLVNEEKITYGSRVSIYTNMVAELLLRIFQSKSQSSRQSISIRLIGSIVSLKGPDKNDASVKTPPVRYSSRIITIESYEQRIEESLGIAAVRRGLSRNQLNWKLATIKLKDARSEPELKICDLLSYASYDLDEPIAEKYARSSPSNKKILRDAFGIFDQTMQTTDVLEKIDKLVGGQAFSSALIVLAENLVTRNETEYFKVTATKQLNFVLDRMAQIGSRGRDAHLAVLIAWLNQIIGQERQLSVGFKMASWLKENVSKPLAEKVKQLNPNDTLVWFDFSIQRWLLTAANHRGSLLEAQEAAEEINKLSSSLAKQSEHLPLLIDGLIVQAVHQTDCYDFETAVRNLKQIAALQRLQTQSLGKLMPKPLNEPLRSDALAKTLGTLTTSLILAGFKNKSEVSYAREESDKAIDEFAGLQDKQRQYQYRCHLETLAGDFTAAKLFLLKSLQPVRNGKNVTHKELLRAIMPLEEEHHFKYFFTLAHWLRIGATASRQRTSEQQSEFQEFVETLDNFSFLEKYTGEKISTDFPAHLILKNIAVIESARGKVTSSLQFLQRLDKIIEINASYLILPLIQIAAHAEVAANLLDCSESGSILDSHAATTEMEHKPENGLKQILEKLLSNEVNRFPALDAKIQDWQSQINQIASGAITQSKSRKMLFKIADEIRY